jgi:hypothetical protein
MLPDPQWLLAMEVHLLGTRTKRFSTSTTQGSSWMLLQYVHVSGAKEWVERVVDAV